MIAAEEITKKLSTDWAGKMLLCLKETDSTNDYLKKMAGEGAAHGTLVVAEKQHAGKGRRGRVWDSPEQSGIFMSLLLRPEIRPEYASMLTLVAALSVSRAIEEVTHLEPKIKWPNDLVVNGKKVTGILTEMSAEAEQIHYVVIGIGVNVNRKEFPKDISQTATSLWLETGCEISRETLIASILNYFEEDFKKFAETDNLSLLMEEYNDRLINRNREVRILESDGEYKGKALGINETGGLLVEKEDLSVEVITSGEVSVRGVYGYV